MSSFKKPIFIFSLPRSGSTLLQRMLMTHPAIKSVAEPWLLLPIFFAQRSSGAFTAYNHSLGHQAFNDFIGNLPDGKEGYRKELSEFVRRLYAKHCQHGEEYFLDKTPRYYWIIDEIAECFPDAKFIFLFRNPLEVLGSMLSTWTNQSLKQIHVYHSDLHEGPPLLLKGFEKLENRSLRLQYEDLLNHPETELLRICDYLDIPCLENMLDDFRKMRPEGLMGDQTGLITYQTLSKVPLNKWLQYTENLAHRSYFKSYVNSLDTEHLEQMGYPKEGLLQSIQSNRLSSLGQWKEWIYWLRGYLVLRFRMNLIFFRKGKSNKLDYFS